MTYARHDALSMVRVNGTRLANAFNQASAKGAHAFVFGSSLHTVNGAGSQFGAWLNYAAACTYGMSYATPWVPVTDLPYNSTNYKGQWGCNTAKGNWANPTGMTYESNGEADCAYTLPGFAPYKAPINTTGYANMFEPDCGSLSQGASPEPYAFFPMGASDRYRCEMIVHAYGGMASETVSGTKLTWDGLKNPAYKPANIFSTGTSFASYSNLTIPNSGSLNSSTPKAFLSYLPSDNSGTPYDFAIDSTKPYTRVQVYVPAAGTAFFMSAMRWRLISGTAPTGMCFSLAGAGGWSAGDLLSVHASFGQTMSVMSPDIAILAYHCNSAYIQHFTPDQYYTRMLALCQYIRSTNPNTAIVLAGDHYRYDATANATDEDNHSRYTGADYTLVDQGYADAAINSHLACDRGPRVPSNISPSGLTYIGAWAASTAYVKGNVVRQNNVAGPARYYRCVQDHTSAAADQPGRDQSNAHQYWYPYFLGGGNTADSASFNPVSGYDIIHILPHGQRQEAAAWWNLLQAAANKSFQQMLRSRVRPGRFVRS